MKEQEYFDTYDTNQEFQGYDIYSTYNNFYNNEYSDDINEDVMRNQTNYPLDNSLPYTSMDSIGEQYRCYEDSLYNSPNIYNSNISSNIYPQFTQNTIPQEYYEYYTNIPYEEDDEDSTFRKWIRIILVLLILIFIVSVLCFWFAVTDITKI